MKEQLSKKYGYTDDTGGNHPSYKMGEQRPAIALPAPKSTTLKREANKATTKKLLKEQQAKEAVTKQSDITSRSKIVRPLSLAEKNELAELRSLDAEITKATSYEKAKLREDFANKIK